MLPSEQAVIRCSTKQHISDFQEGHKEMLYKHHYGQYIPLILIISLTIPSIQGFELSIWHINVI